MQKLFVVLWRITTMASIGEFSLQEMQTIYVLRLHWHKNFSLSLVFSSCGDLLFDDMHPLNRILVQKQNLTCESPIEVSYFNHLQRRLKLKDFCIRFGEIGGKSFLLGLHEFREHCLTDGYRCYPIYIPCLDSGLKVGRGRKKDEVQAKKESTDKVAAKAASKVVEKAAKAVARKND